MAEHRPLVLKDGYRQELPTGDFIAQASLRGWPVYIQTTDPHALPWGEHDPDVDTPSVWVELEEVTGDVETIWVEDGIPFSPYNASKYPQPLEAVWASDPLQAKPADGSGVASWRNGGSRGSGNVTQPTSNNRPLWRRAGIGLRPAFWCDGVNDNLSVAVANIAQPFKLLVLVQLDATWEFLSFLAIGDPPGRLGISQDRWIVNSGTGSNVFSNVGAPKVGRLTALRSQVLEGDTKLWDNGTLAATGANGSGIINQLRIGATNETGGNPLRGHIAYAGIYDGSVSDAALAELEADMLAYYDFDPFGSQFPTALHGVWASDPLWVPPNYGLPGSTVPSMRNISGGGNPSQATESFKPTFRYGLNGRASVLFDGIDDYLDTSITSTPQPYQILSVFNTHVDASSQLMIGLTTSRGVGIYSSNPRKWGIFGGGTGGVLTQDSPGIDLGIPHVFHGLFNTADSTFQVDNNPVTEGQSGETGQDLSRISLGAGVNSSSVPDRWISGDFGFVGYYPPEADLTQLKAALREYYRITS